MLGFSDHAPFPDKDYGLRMHYCDLDDYLSSIASLAEEYKDSIKLFKGLEIEFMPQYIDYYKTLYSDHGMEYLVLGEHIYMKNETQLRNIFFAQSSDDYIDYADAIVQALDTKLFTFIAHPDIMFINDIQWDNNCDKACEMILCAAEKYDIPVEFNANGIRRGKRMYPDGIRYPYPHMRFWERLKGSKQKVIIGSDAHIPEQIIDNSVKISEDICSSLGLNIIYDPISHKEDL